MNTLLGWKVIKSISRSTVFCWEIMPSRIFRPARDEDIAACQMNHRCDCAAIMWMYGIN